MKNISMFKDFLIESEKSNNIIWISISKEDVKYHFKFDDSVKGEESEIIKKAMLDLRQQVFQYYTNQTIHKLHFKIDSQGSKFSRKWYELEAYLNNNVEFILSCNVDRLIELEKAKTLIMSTVNAQVDAVINEEIESAVLNTIQYERNLA